MSDSLNAARQTVETLIEAETVPQQLVGEITTPDLIRLVESLIGEVIKDTLSETQAASDEAAEQIITAMAEQVAIRVGLIAIQATIQETVGGGITGSEPDLEWGVSPETATEIVTALLRGGLTIRLNVEPE